MSSSASQAHAFHQPVCQRRLDCTIGAFYMSIPAEPSQQAFYVNLHRAVIGPSATLTGRWRPDIDLRRMLTGFSPSEWDPDPQCQAAQAVQWLWWWQYLTVWHCRSVWSLPCHFAADLGGLVLSMARSHWHEALRSAHKSCTRGHVSWKRGGGKRELVAASWTSSKRFSHVLWLKVHSHRLQRACLLGCKRKLYHLQFDRYDLDFPLWSYVSCLLYPNYIW